MISCICAEKIEPQSLLGLNQTAGKERRRERGRGLRKQGERERERAWVRMGCFTGNPAARQS